MTFLSSNPQVGRVFLELFLHIKGIILRKRTKKRRVAQVIVAKKNHKILWWGNPFIYVSISQLAHGEVFSIEKPPVLDPDGHQSL